MKSSFDEYLTSTSIVLGTTLLALLAHSFVGNRTIALIYLATIGILGLFLGHGPIVVAASFSALIWDFCFLTPVAQFTISDVEDLVSFGVYLGAALLLGNLMAQMCARQKLRQLTEDRATALYLLVRDLSNASSLHELVQAAVERLGRAYGAHVVVLLASSPQKLSFQPHPASTYDISGPEQPIAERVFSEGQPLTAPNSFPQGETVFVALRLGQPTLGVLGLSFQQSLALNSWQQELLDALVQEVALALDRFRLQQESESARLMTASDDLIKNLLHSVSCAIERPFGAVKAAIRQLAEAQKIPPPGLRQALVTNIQQAAESLDDLVHNFLVPAHSASCNLELSTMEVPPSLKEVPTMPQVAPKQTASMYRKD